MDTSRFKELYSEATLALSSIYPTKTQGPYRIPRWLFKKNADNFGCALYGQTVGKKLRAITQAHQLR